MKVHVASNDRIWHCTEQEDASEAHSLQAAMPVVILSNASPESAGQNVGRDVNNAM